MLTYIIGRLLLAIPTVVLVSLLIFFMIRLIPGSIIDLMVDQMEYYTEKDRIAIERELGLDVPVFTQYGLWMGVVPQEDGSFNSILQGNLGKSMWRNLTG